MPPFAYRAFAYASAIAITLGVLNVITERAALIFV